MRYDYLIVGAGLFGAVFAHEAAAAGKNASVSTKENIWAAIYIQKKKKAYRFISMEPIYFIPLIEKFGTM